MKKQRPRERWTWKVGRWIAVMIAAVVGWTIASPSVAWDDTVKPAPAPITPAAAGAPANAPLTSLDQAVVIGASVSDGFGTTVSPPAGPSGTPDRVVLVKLADILGAVAKREQPLPSSTSAFFFQRPDETAEKQLAFAKAASPKVVFAIDYLFWHSYGGGMTDAQRFAALERGLTRLDQLNVPTVVCDLPDMSHAIGLMLATSQVPKKATLEKLNARINEWAMGRKNVVVLPMTDVVANAMADRALTLGGRDFPAGKSRGLLTADGLHATTDGEIAVSLEAIDRLIAAGVLDKSIGVERDPDAVKARLLVMKAPKSPPTPSTPADPKTAPGTPAPATPAAPKAPPATAPR